MHEQIRGAFQPAPSRSCPSSLAPLCGRVIPRCPARNSAYQRCPLDRIHSFRCGHPARPCRSFFSGPVLRPRRVVAQHWLLASSATRTFAFASAGGLVRRDGSGIRLTESAIWRGVGPAGVGQSASRLIRPSTAAEPSSTAARSSSVSGMFASMCCKLPLASSNCALLESFGR